MMDLIATATNESESAVQLKAQDVATKLKRNDVLESFLTKFPHLCAFIDSQLGEFDTKKRRANDISDGGFQKDFSQSFLKFYKGIKEEAQILKVFDFPQYQDVVNLSTAQMLNQLPVLQAQHVAQNSYAIVFRVKMYVYFRQWRSSRKLELRQSGSPNVESILEHEVDALNIKDLKFSYLKQQADALVPLFKDFPRLFHSQVHLSALFRHRMTFISYMVQNPAEASFWAVGPAPIDL